MNADATPSPARAGASRPALHPVDWTVQSGAVDDVLRAMDGSLARRRRRRRRLAVAAGAAAALIAAVVSWPPAAWPSADAAAAPAVVVTQPARRVLPDGTLEELRRGARITTEFTTAARRVVLMQGQAHFQVTKDAARPFVVAVGGVEVRAVGTAFAVDLGPKSVEVLVTEGRVALDGARTEAGPPSTAPAPLAYLDAGHHAVVEFTSPAAAPAAPQVVAVAPAEIAERLAWRVPRLEFSGTPLSEALALIGRHHPVRYTLAEPAIGQLRVSGILRADNTENLWRLLEEQHGIRVERRADGTVALSRAR
ncbi:MAG: FecR domain-containing protein [Verrucomicrobia bacterium]|nr:FecR domain-containing protein [Verrucomicrobiota bacterium]